jgi:hypothetical protein
MHTAGTAAGERLQQSVARADVTILAVVATHLWQRTARAHLHVHKHGGNVARQNVAATKRVSGVRPQPGVVEEVCSSRPQAESAYLSACNPDRCLNGLLCCWSDSPTLFAGLPQSNSRARRTLCGKLARQDKGVRCGQHPARTCVGPPVAGAQQHLGPARHAPHVQALAQAAPADAPGQLTPHPVLHCFCTAAAFALQGASAQAQPPGCAGSCRYRSVCTEHQIAQHAAHTPHRSP